VGRQGTHRKFNEEFKRLAVERMQTADHIGKLAKELGIERAYLYKWEAQLRGKRKAPAPILQERTISEAEEALQREVSQLREALGKRALEVEFFKGALQRIEARRQSNTATGGTASTTKSVD
jgi:transposase-like protein